MEMGVLRSDRRGQPVAEHHQRPARLVRHLQGIGGPLVLARIN